MLKNKYDRAKFKLDLIRVKRIVDADRNFRNFLYQRRSPTKSAVVAAFNVIELIKSMIDLILDLIFSIAKFLSHFAYRCNRMTQRYHRNRLEEY